VGGNGTEAAAAAAEPAGAGEEELEEVAEADEDARTTCLPAVVSIVMMPGKQQHIAYTKTRTVDEQFGQPCCQASEQERAECLRL
jgi:hypothetical protein